MSSFDDNFHGDHTRADYLEAMANAPRRLLSDEQPLAEGLPSDEYLRPYLWSLDLRRRMTPAMIEEDAKLTREFLADLHGPVSD